ncbi:MAG: MaoC family dehydratase [Chloroflexi bacterium]|nr:MaoC family dehydratase [Chloroflexota bacterium]
MTAQEGKTAEQLQIGEKASIAKTIVEADVRAFAEITTDTNPVHLDAMYASKTIFRERVAHGMLVASLISAVVGTRLPGLGTIYLSQNLEFKAPVKLGDTIEAEVEVLEVIVARNRVRLRTTCRNKDRNGQIVIDGEALVMPPHKRKG